MNELTESKKHEIRVTRALSHLRDAMNYLANKSEDNVIEEEVLYSLDLLYNLERVLISAIEKVKGK